MIIHVIKKKFVVITGGNEGFIKSYYEKDEEEQ